MNLQNLDTLCLSIYSENKWNKDKSKGFYLVDKIIKLKNVDNNSFVVVNNMP